MAEKQVRYVSVVPLSKIKKEPIDFEDLEVSVKCKVCNKTFVTDKALSNHVRMEHFDVYATGNRALWAEDIVKQSPSPAAIPTIKKERVNMTAAKLLSSMGPTSLMSLASKDVSYIIIKGSSKSEPRGVKESKERKRKGEKEKIDQPDAKREREPQPITGPFECLQPSPLATDGTCHQIFFSCCEYSAHCRDEHTRRRKGIRCQVCEKPLAGAGDSQAPFPCDVCGMGFRTNKELSEHMALDHVKLKPFECSVCHKRFTQQGGVQQHMRMHTGDRPFPCTFCSKAFTQKSGLDQHLRIHTKVKPYRCIVCSKTFCQSVHLKQHMRTHTNVSPFQCGICSKRFKQSSHLNYHLKNHNPAVMSDEQKTEYNKMLAMISKEDKLEKIRSVQTQNQNVQNQNQSVQNQNQHVQNKNVICIQGQNGLVEYLEVHDDQIQCDEVEMEAEVVEDEVQVVEEDQEGSQDQQVDNNELLLADNSIQDGVETTQDGDTYILGDCQGDGVWSVRLVANESEE